MKNLVKAVLALSFLTLVSCNEKIKGNLALKSQLSVNVTQKSNWCNDGSNCEEVVAKTLPAGDYSAQLQFIGKRDVEMQVNVNRDQWRINIHVPKGSDMPTENGSISLTSQQTGQPFDLSGDVKTQKENGQTVREHEQCSYTDYRHECYVTGNPPTTVCRDVPYTRWGYRDVEYYNVKAHREVEMNVLAAQSSEVVGKFTAVNDWTERVYTYQGRCW